VTGWVDRDGHPVAAPEPPPAGSYYRPIGDFQAGHYERNAFTRGTAQEAAHLWDALGLAPGAVSLDVGCGTGRHVRAFVARGARAYGIDISRGLLAAGGIAAAQADARRLPVASGACDAVVSLCQGAFGITPGGDRAVLVELARVLRPGGRLALTAFALVFAARWLAPDDAIDLRRGLHYQRAEVRGPDDARRHFDLWTTCYSPAHLDESVTAAGLHVESLSGVEPGAYGTDPPTLDHPEYLVIAVKP
jgi:SAM-dependent methyltransferase